MPHLHFAIGGRPRQSRMLIMAPSMRRMIFLLFGIFSVNGALAEPPVKSGGGALQAGVLYDLSLKQLTHRAKLIVVATCAFPDRACRSGEGTVAFKVQKTLRGPLPRLEDWLDVASPDLDAFRGPGRSNVPTRELIHGYRSSLGWTEAIRQPLILFLAKEGDGSFRFIAPGAYENITRMGEVEAWIRSGTRAPGAGAPGRAACGEGEALRAAKEASRKYCGSRRGCRIEAHWIANSLPKAYDSSREWSVSVTPESGPLQGDPVVIWISVECRVTGVLSVGREMGLEDWQRSFHAGPGGRR